MKIYLQILLIVITFSRIQTVSSRQLPQNDDYDIGSVKSLVSDQNAKISGTTGWDEKMNNRLGDRVSIALLKIYDENELAAPSNVKAYLPVIGSSFDFPELIERKEDKQPKVTLFLLHYLEKNVKETGLRKKVTELISTLAKLETPAAK